MAELNSKNPAVYEALKIELENKLEKLSQKVKTQKNKILYHYTSLSGFKGIIENKCFYSSNSVYLNDKEEFYYGINLFKEYCISRGDYHKELIDEIINDLNSKNTSNHYVTCFSLEGDLLSQWRAYADDGKGISIGFDSKKILEAFKSKATGSNIIYNKSTQSNEVKKIFDEIFNFYISKLSIIERLNEPNMFKLIAQEINEILDKYIGQFKHSSFKEEREYRFDLSIEKEINKNRELSYRVSRNNFLVPYLHLKTDYQDEIDKLTANKTNKIDPTVLEKNFKVKNLPIKEIIIGPSLDFELNKKSLDGFLKKCGYDNEIKIIPSSVPYRI